ncbi:ribokinase [Bradyrhizobium stylosanthis]|uniref:ribokinase n=1 Tax=Bradyrhizobium stylosanthis TaxID=1803665 RepID=UPI0007C4B341|nr:ribokinase [Bradyrhizobium stylosanthis]
MSEITIFGSINVDLVAGVDTIARPGETVLASGYATLCGGKGANQAVAAARVSPQGRVAMVGRVGRDAFGQRCIDNLAANGVNVDRVTVGAEPTGCAFISVSADGENAITVASGANGCLAADATAELSATTTLVLQMEVPFATSLLAARRVRAAGGRVVWNLAPVPERLSEAELRALLEATSVLVVNEHEALTAAQRFGWTGTDFEAATAALAADGGVTCIVTAGPLGARAFHPDGAHQAVAAERILPIDTTGAGDTFVGILAAGLDEGRGWQEVLARACRGASLACLAHGAQRGMPTAEQLS